jgi:hypothetical protein
MILVIDAMQGLLMTRQMQPDVSFLAEPQSPRAQRESIERFLSPA